MQITVSDSLLCVLFLQCDLRHCHVLSSSVGDACIHYHHAVQNRQGCVHEGTGGMGCGYVDIC